MPACVGRIQYTPGTYSGGHLNMQRTSLLILTPAWVEDEGDGARKGKRKMVPVSLQEWGSWYIIPKYPGSSLVTTCVFTDILQEVEPSATFQMILRH